MPPAAVRHLRREGRRKRRRPAAGAGRGKTRFCPRRFPKGSIISWWKSNGTPININMNMEKYKMYNAYKIRNAIALAWFAALFALLARVATLCA